MLILEKGTSCWAPQWDESSLGWLTVLLISLASIKPHLELVLRLLLGKCDSLMFACIDHNLFILTLFRV